ncbi:hypothetical protein Cob_v002452 [Colletotrichum orbiculare MAFF 240422]|uniref:Nucleoside phosphorylase domain-containing protein n=1 Tax=Colletotrichum orbiculare (strain 104-T / ATCC 96160 / CBS 514.97 / LARS 414 / MAFF 240422) TaxID=1213857 RepID=A0A484G542_COLOR|nr:hypothetical protein Cob_v002452 [Colletotrichum orbiculare MAFF 240422]
MNSKRKRGDADADADCVSQGPPKKQRRRHSDYTIGWICALPLEMTAAISMLDEEHDSLEIDRNDTNHYVLGKIKSHNVVVACLPLGEYGTNNAANVMTNLKRSFPSIQEVLLVGIGGGAPSQADVRLGDVVVGIRVMQCDFGKVVGDGELRRTAAHKLPPLVLGTALSVLRAKHPSEKSEILSILEKKLGETSDYNRPDSPDLLFSSTYKHVPSAPDCSRCDHMKLVPRRERKSNHPHIHYGVLASGNQVMRSASKRDEIARDLDALGFEMEAAGLMGNFPCLCIRGICDYSDSHKSKEWQKRPQEKIVLQNLQTEPNAMITARH